MSDEMLDEDDHLFFDNGTECPAPPTTNEDIPLYEMPTQVISPSKQSGSQVQEDLNFNESDDEFLANLDESFLEDYELPQTQQIPQNPTGEHVYEYEGVKIYFPHPAYDSQQDMMKKTIKGVKEGHHCLLESPTGTGKTLALLCPLRAWQIKEEGDRRRGPFTRVDPAYLSPKKFKLDLNESNSSPVKNQGNVSNNSVFEDSSTSLNNSTNNAVPSTSNHDDDDNEIPIIYYATRTHSQIKQVVAQLKTTAYSTTPISVLSSRRQSCVNEKVMKGNYPSEPPRKLGVDEYCDRLRANWSHNLKAKCSDPKNANFVKLKPTCSNYNAIRTDPTLFADFLNERNQEVWDIEDIRGYAKKCGTCAYYGARELAKDAKIVFCTYQHLLHDQIRNACKIKLKNNIIVFDESHNVEDLCRELGTIKLTLSNIVSVIDRGLAEASLTPEWPQIKSRPLQNLSIVITRLKHWLMKEEDEDPTANGFKIVFDSRLPREERKYVKNLSKEEGKVIEVFRSVGLGPEHMKELWSDYFILEDRHYTIETEPEDRHYKVDNQAMRAISSLFYSLDCLYMRKENGGEYFHHVKDYEVLLVKRGGLNKNSSSSGLKRKYYDLELLNLCLNPGIVFSKMKEARTVIVTSGTLSPTCSFSSELDCHFEQELSASHVLGRDRLFTCVINSLKNNTKILNFSQSYLNKDDNYAQHARDLGEIVYQICKNVPYGILVFMPSKSFTERLKRTWTNTGALQKISTCKDFYFEHEWTTPEKFREMMKHYRESLTLGKKKGGILFAILRGKVSEGVDFKDNQARAVVCIGIPYAPLKDEGVEAKKRYNDAKKKNAGNKCVSGSEWYDANAFRALNQAFGRVVRHSKDWGAVFIIDDRLKSEARKRLYLSKWIRESIVLKQMGSFDSILPDLQKFLQRLTAEESEC